MSDFLQLAILLAIIILAAKSAGYLTRRLGQPSVLGELIVGLILGPSLIDIVHLPFVSNSHIIDTIAELAEFGVLFLMFLAGLELHLSELARNTKVSALAGSLGVVVPVGLGWLAGTASGMNTQEAFFLGLTIGATSVSISAQTLMELKVLRSRVGLSLLGAAVFDDVLVILILSAFLAVVNGGGGFVAILMVFVKMLIFLALSVAVGIWLLPRLAKRVSKMPVSQGMLAFAIVILLIYGVAAELVGGMAAITGSFLAGLMFSRTPYKSYIEEGMQAVAFGFFVPIFFVNIGLSIDMSTLPLDTLWILALIVFTAVAGKLIGSGLGARLGNLNWKESLQLGIGMVSRGEVGLIIANVGLNQGLVSNEEFSAIIGMVLVTTLITPPLLRAAFSSAKDSGSQMDQKEKTEIA